MSDFKVYLDFDSTLVDLMSEWMSWLKKEKYIKESTKNILHWEWLAETYGEHVNDFWKQSGIYKNILPINGSVEFVYLLQKMYGKENVVVISKCVKSNQEEKVKYSEKIFGVLPNNFINASDKWQFTSDGILIDDAPHNVIDHVKRNNKPGILFNYRNRYGWANIKENIPFVSKCKDYAECLEVIDKSKKFFEKV